MNVVLTYKINMNDWENIATTTITYISPYLTDEQIMNVAESELIHTFSDCGLEIEIISVEIVK